MKRTAELALAELLKAQRWRNRAEALLAIAEDQHLRRIWYRRALIEIAQDYAELADQHDADERRQPN